MSGRFKTGTDFFKALVGACVTYGTRASPRGLPVVEIPRPSVFTLSDTLSPYVISEARKSRHRFGLIEAAWMLAGRDDAATLSSIVPRMREFSDDGQKLWGAYGPRLRDQMQHVLGTLRRDPDSRQAVVTTWRPMTPPWAEEDEWASLQPPFDGGSWRSKDVPCTVAWMFTLSRDRDGSARKLDLTVVMRSHDAWLGAPYDLLSFTTVQRVVASCLGVSPGEYTLVVNNLHLYERDLDSAVACLKEPERAQPKTAEFGPLFQGLSWREVAKMFKLVLAGQSVEGLGLWRAAVADDSSVNAEYGALRRRAS